MSSNHLNDNEEKELLEFINQVDSVDALRSIGLSTRQANSLLKFKAERGKLNSLDELLEINGIGKRTLAKIKLKGPPAEWKHRTFGKPQKASKMKKIKTVKPIIAQGQEIDENIKFGDVIGICGVLLILFFTLLTIANNGLPWFIASATVGSIIGLLTFLLLMAALSDKKFPNREVTLGYTTAIILGIVSALIIAPRQFPHESKNITLESKKQLSFVLPNPTERSFLQETTSNFRLKVHLARALAGHTSAVSSVAFSRDGKLLASGSYGKIKVWDILAEECIRTIGGHANFVTSVAFSPDGKLLVSGSEDCTVKIWDGIMGKCIRAFKFAYQVNSVTFSPNGKYLASGLDDKTVKIWDITGDLWYIQILKGHTNEVTSVAFSPDGKLLASGSCKDWYWATGCDRGEIKVWDVMTGKCVRTIGGHADFVTSITFSPDGKLLASGSEDGTVILWDATTGRFIRTLKHPYPVDSITFSPDGKILISAGGWKITFWDIFTKRQIQTIRKYMHRVITVSFSPDGRFLAVGLGDGTIELWEVEMLLSNLEKSLSQAFHVWSLS